MTTTSQVTWLQSMNYSRLEQPKFKRLSLRLLKVSRHRSLVEGVSVISVMCSYLLAPWRYSSCITLAASHIPLFVRFRDEFLQGGVGSPTPNPPTWRARVSLIVWHLPRNLTGMGGPTSSYAAADIALEFIGAHKPLTQQRSAFDKVEIPSRGNVF
jgi:hypothetical protein